MCTVSWTFTESGYHLFFNRDELRTRGNAIPPRELDVDGVRCLAPIDSDSGGSWVVTNEYGITFGILNYYDRDVSDIPVEELTGSGNGIPSRGPLLLSLAAARSKAEGIERLKAAAFHRYRPFTVFGLEPGGSCTAIRLENRGDRNMNEWCPDPAFLASSGFKPDRVIAARAATYRDIVGGDPTPDRLLEFHRSRHPAGGAYSVCMERDDAMSVNFCWITVDAEVVNYRFSDGPPCRTSLSEPVVMPRARE